MAQELPEKAWGLLSRKLEYEAKGPKRQRPENVKEREVREHEYINRVLLKEDVAEFDYSPVKCKKTYRMVMVRKLISVEQGQKVLFPEHRYFFCITNLKDPAPKIVESADARCNQENHLAQLKDLRPHHSPVDNLESDWAYMVMASLAWSLKAWYALLLPVSGRWREKHETEKDTVLKMEFRTFLNAFIRMPAQIVRTGRRIVYRLLGWNRWQNVFLRGFGALRAPALC